MGCRTSSSAASRRPGRRAGRCRRGKTDRARCRRGPRGSSRRRRPDRRSSHRPRAPGLPAEVQRRVGLGLGRGRGSFLGSGWLVVGGVIHARAAAASGWSARVGFVQSPGRSRRQSRGRRDRGTRSAARRGTLPARRVAWRCPQAALVLGRARPCRLPLRQNQRERFAVVPLDRRLRAVVGLQLGEELLDVALAEASPRAFVFRGEAAASRAGGRVERYGCLTRDAQAGWRGLGLHIGPSAGFSRASGSARPGP